MRALHHVPLRHLRDAAWITEARLMLWGVIFGTVWLCLLGYDAFDHMTHGVMNAEGEQLSRDFVNFWSGARSAAAGHAMDVYDVWKFHAFEQSLIGAASEFKMYNYPPVMLLLCRPLAGLPYKTALILWVLAGATLCCWPLSRIVGWPKAALALIAAPAGFLNLYAGQNGYFTAALLAGGISLLDRRPLLAGLVLGMLCYKPQFGIVLPVALVAGGYWRSLAAAAASAGLLIGASILLYGAESWVAFAHQTALLGRFLVPFHSPRMPSVYVAMLLLAVPPPVASLVQGASTLCAVIAVFRAWRVPAASLGVKAAILIVATFLATPYAWDYDAVLLIFAAAWLAGAGRGQGFAPWEKSTVLLLLILPAITLLPAKLLGLQLAPLLLWGALLVLLRRAYARERRRVPVTARNAPSVFPR